MAAGGGHREYIPVSFTTADTGNRETKGVRLVGRLGFEPRTKGL